VALEHTVRTATFDVLRRLELTTIFSNGRLERARAGDEPLLLEVVVAQDATFDP
jgi:hypothetical protein